MYALLIEKSRGYMEKVPLVNTEEVRFVNMEKVPLVETEEVLLVNSTAKGFTPLHIAALVITFLRL